MAAATPWLRQRHGCGNARGVTVGLGPAAVAGRRASAGQQWRATGPRGKAIGRTTVRGMALAALVGVARGAARTMARPRCESHSGGSRPEPRQVSTPWRDMGASWRERGGQAARAHVGSRSAAPEPQSCHSMR